MENKAQFLELLERLYTSCQSVKGLTHLTEDDLTPIVESVQERGKGMLDYIGEKLDTELSRVDVQRDLIFGDIDEYSEEGDKIGDEFYGALYDVLWSAVFDYIEG